jgi:hypothetical protein
MKNETLKETIGAIIILAFFAALAFLLISMTGCCVSSGKMTHADGTIQQFSNVRFAWSTESYKFAYTTNSVSLDVQKSNTDAQTVTAVAELIKVAKP